MIPKLGELQDDPSPVMTFQADNTWLAVPVAQLESVIAATRLWPVPMTQDEYIGLYDSGQELIPVLSLSSHPTPPDQEQLIAILHVRGESIGLAIQRAGQVQDRYMVEQSPELEEAGLSRGALFAQTADSSFWILDVDALWPQAQSGSIAHNPTGL